jgi:hypothetical protein
LAWALVTTQEKRHALAPEVYEYKAQARSQAERLAADLGQMLGSAPRVASGGWEIGEVIVHVAPLDIPGTIPVQVFIGTRWAPDGSMSAGAVLLPTRQSARNWVAEEGIPRGTSEDSWSLRASRDVGAARVASSAKVIAWAALSR